MGCSASKNITVEPLDDNKLSNFKNGIQEFPRDIATARKVSDILDLEGVDPQTEFLEPGNVNNVHQTQSGLSFEIPFEEEPEVESIIRKYPPRRFQKLEEQETPQPATLAQLQEKMEGADLRRQQILLQRIQSAQIKPVVKKQPTVYSINENGVDHLQIPDNIPDSPFIASSGYI